MRSAPPTCRSYWCSTRSTCSTPASSRSSSVDRFELEGVQVPRVFVSGRTSAGLPALRRQLARELSQRNPLPATVDEKSEIRGTAV